MISYNLEIRDSGMDHKLQVFLTSDELGSIFILRKLHFVQK